MNKKKRHGLYMMISGVVIGVLGIVLLNQKPEVKVEEKPVADFEVGNYKFSLEKLLTEDQRVKGLSGRASLAPDKGLLFVLDAEEKAGIWMKEMNFPISIVWLDKDCKVTGFKDIALPESYPEVFYPELPSKYVIETNPISVDVEEGTDNLLSIGSKLTCHFLPK